MGSRAQAQQLGHMSFGALWHVGSSRTRNQTSVPWIASRFLTTGLPGKPCRLFNDGHSDQSELVPHCTFDLHFSNISMLSIFSCAYWPSVCLLWRNVCLGLLPIFWLGYLVFLLLSFMDCLYILEINSLSAILFANTSSYSVGYLFILLMFSFAVQKLISLIRSHLFIFAFASIALEKLLLFLKH